MSDEPRDEASAPWERPGRWSHQRMDATTVDDLLARLETTDAPGESRRQRRASADLDDAVPAGELIAALSSTDAANPAAADVPEGTTESFSSTTAGPPASGPPVAESLAESAAPSVTGLSPEPFIDLPSDPDGQVPVPAQPATGSSPEPATDLSSDPDGQVPAQPAIGSSPEPATRSAVSDADRSRLLTSAAGAVAAFSALSRTQAPVTHSSADPNADMIGVGADALGATRPTDSDDGPHTHPIGTVVEPDLHSDVARDSILASLRRELRGEVAPTHAAMTDANGTAGKSRSRAAYGDAHRHRGWWTAGRAAVAAVAALVLLITGTEWTIKHRADQVLADNHISAVVPDDTNISTPTVNAPTDQAAGTQTGTNSAAPVANQGAGNQTYQAENILLMGSDTRLGKENAKLGGVRPGEDTTMQSDVLMVAHLSADRQHVTIVSIPRDLYITAPTCKAWDYATNTLSSQDYVSPYTEWKITNAFSVGGPQCTVKAIQELTGLKINRVIIIDFQGFKDMVDALHGITIDVCKPIIDGQLGTVIATGGVQKIDGTQALNLVRARKVQGDGTGDLGRIRRQQVVLSTLLRQVTRAGTLLNPAKLDALLQAFAHNVQSDNVTLDDLLQLAQSLGNLSPSHVTFYTLPTVADGDGLDATPVAAEVFNALVNDQPLPGEATETTKKTTTATTAATTSAASASSASTSAAPQTLSIEPDEVQLQVVNVSGRSGVATKTMASLNELGFAITEDDLLLPENQVQTAVTVEYDPSNEAAALTVAAAVPGATLVPTTGLGSVVKLMLGTDFDDSVQAVAVGQIVIPTVSASDTPSSSSSSSSSAPTTTSAASQTLTTQQVSEINAGNAGCA